MEYLIAAILFLAAPIYGDFWNWLKKEFKKKNK